MRNLKEKVALVTGGSSGMGLATAMRFAEAGAKVVIVTDSDSEAVGERLATISPEPSLQRTNEYFQYRSHRF